ncbi:MAG TPA: rod shape-determining protein MreC, partial [Candidatus Limnocylindrales bacterium]|nr:rod shape-determining protein MreC [Candidatus Limnocylindrales bacterium]
ADEVERQNEILAGMLQLQNSFPYKTAAAEVIARESDEFRRVITISKGTDAGIKEGDVVIAEGGPLAGRVTEVGPNYSKVVLITDQTSTVIGRLQTSQATGKVVGQLEETLQMTNIDSTEVIELGEEVVTAGTELAGGIRSPYPKGLLLGRVIDVRRDANSVVQTAFLEPTANLEKIEYVLVVLDYIGGLPPADDQPIDCSITGPGGALPGGEQPCIEPTPSPSPSASVPPASQPLVP